MKIHFFPRDRYFWMCHFGLTGLYVFWSLLAPIFLKSNVLRNVICYLLGSLGFTLVILCFRWLIKARKSISISMIRLGFFVFFYGIVAGFSVSFFVILLEPTISIHLVDDYEKWPIWGAIFYHGTQNFLLICAWIFAYFSITNNRRAQSAELFNLRLQNSLKEAQMSSLSNQLNPHFLFNSLNNIRFMIHENPVHADEMITSLSDILRYSLESSKHEKVCLLQELNVVNQYIDIVKTQMEDRLEFVMSVPENLNGFLVPPMVLQMLVENAIKHGLDHLPKGGCVDVTIFDQGSHLAIEINNDLANGTNLSNHSTGIGLANIKKRLQILYGDLATLVANRSPSHFKVMLLIPKEFVQ